MPKTHLISFRGAMGAGKTTAANRLVGAHGFLRVSLADALKVEVHSFLIPFSREECYEANDVLKRFRAETGNSDPLPIPGTLVGWYWPNPEHQIDWVNKHKKELRALLQWYGTEYRRGQDDTYWIKKYRAAVDSLLSNGRSVVTDDVRFPNELEALRSLGGVDVLIETSARAVSERLMQRDGLDTRGITGHASESSLSAETHAPDFTLFNGPDRPLHDFHNGIDKMLEAITQRFDVTAFC